MTGSCAVVVLKRAPRHRVGRNIMRQARNRVRTLGRMSLRKRWPCFPHVRTYFHEVPWTYNPRGALICLHLDEYCADVRDGANMRALANPIAYLESHLPTSKGALLPTSRLGASRPSRPGVEPRDSQFSARMPTEGASAVAPIDFVLNRVRVNDDAGTAPAVSPRQHGIADDRSARVSPDDHGRLFPIRCLISATNRCPWSSTTSQENGPRNCVAPSVWTVRRATSSDPMFASRRPSLVMSIHIATAVDRHCWPSGATAVIPRG
jgi:hypothetical protein